ncbi:MAG: hypothetical protein ABEI52_05690, partial [Halobacteriaceae archaeon]
YSGKGPAERMSLPGTLSDHVYHDTWGRASCQERPRGHRSPATSHLDHAGDGRVEDWRDAVPTLRELPAVLIGCPRNLHVGSPMPIKTHAADGITERCANCEATTVHAVRIELREESDRATNAAFSREPYRVAECTACGEITVTRMNDA